MRDLPRSDRDCATASGSGEIRESGDCVDLFVAARGDEWVSPTPTKDGVVRMIHER